MLLASLPYAILSTTVLMGKHIDKLAWDEPAGTRTLPVMLGEARARAITKVMFVVFYLSVIGLASARVLPFGTPDDVRAEVQQRVRDLAPGGGFVLAAVHNLQPNVSPENIVAMFAAARELGTYPIALTELEH